MPYNFKGTRKELKELLERTSDKAKVTVLDQPSRGHDSLFHDDKSFLNLKREQRKDLSKRGHFRTYAYLRDIHRTYPDDPLPKHDKERNCQFRFLRQPVEITENSIKLMVDRNFVV